MLPSRPEFFGRFFKTRILFFFSLLLTYIKRMKPGCFSSLFYALGLVVKPRIDNRRLCLLSFSLFFCFNYNLFSFK